MNFTRSILDVPHLTAAPPDGRGARLVAPTRTGFACYRGGIEKNEWHGVLVGIADDEATVQAFLRGEEVDLHHR